MKAEYDFSKMKSRKNPYASKLKRQVTIRMGEDVIGYFKDLGQEAQKPELARKLRGPIVVRGDYAFKHPNAVK